jgi:histidinol dehydrogenase
MIDWNQLDSAARQRALARPALADSQQLTERVRNIVDDVIRRGDDAILALTQQFDGAALSSLRLAPAEIERAATELKPSVKQAIDVAYSNIKRFHQQQQPESIRYETMPGVLCEQQTVAIEKVGLYIPGGTAPLPSTVLMLGTPAQVAGCDVRILCTPPSQAGTIAAEIRYAASLCGITEIFLCGGAQAVAGMAFGTASIPKVDKIFGPGNSYVTEAKQQVSTRVNGAAIDMPAGPSEVLVLADKNADPAFVAADLLSQAEHGVDSQAILVTNSASLICDVQLQVEQQLAALGRSAIATEAMQHSRYICTPSFEDAIQVSNQYAPEHLIVQAENARQWLTRIKNAGSIFVGAWSPESAGDYASGTNHVLPTYGYSRMYSSLGLLDFMRRFTVQELTQSGFQTLAPTLVNLANAEGLDAHARAVTVRMEKLEGEAE